jgi:dynein heavy chain, axonemal
MSPIGQAFRNYCRMYPALINNTAIDWFLGWPEDALTEVALKFIGQMGLEPEIHQGLAVTCSYAHSTTNDSALSMQETLKRVFYVTPTNYVELLKGYGQILKDKRERVDNQRTKLRNGLDKLDQARQTVEKMAAEAEIKRIDVSKAQKAAEDLVINIAKERKIADEKQVHIEGETVKIEKEKEETIELAADADRELKKIKAFTSPPPAVETVMSAVMIVLSKNPDWASVKKELTDSAFVKKIMDYDMDNISPVVMKKIEKYTKMENFQPQIVAKTSVAASMLCMWVRSVEDYSKALKIVAPKRAKKAYAEEQLRKKLAYLEELEAEFDILARKLAELQTTYDATMATMTSLRAQLDDIQVKIDRGDKLITGLAGEKTRWEASLILLDDQYEKLIGDCVLAAAFMSYCGPFPSEYRDDLVSSWVSMVQSQHIPFTEGFEFDDFMAGPALARQWQINGLPTDKFSVENAVFVNKGLRWALNIDP